MLASVPHGFCLKRKESASLTITISEGKLSARLFHLIAHDCTCKEPEKKKYFAPTYIRYQKSENIGQPVLPYWFLDLAHMALPTLTALWQSPPQ